MNESMLAGMSEATRLTRSGRLSEATALIQRALRGQYAPAAAAAAEEGHERTPIEGSFRVIKTVPASQPEPSADTPADLFAGLSRGWPNLDLPGLRPRHKPAQPGVNIPSGGRFIEGSFRNQAGARHYKLYIPSGYRGQALPLVVMLHGCTQDPDDFAAGTHMNHLAEARDCLVLYPAQAQSANLQKCWNWFQDGDQRRDSGEPALIAGMTRQIVTEYSLDPRRVYVGGLSSGGAMAAILGATHPDLYTAVGVHSGLAAGSARDLPSAFAAMRQGCAGRGAGARATPAIVFHGDRDTTVHPRNGEQVVAQFAAGVGAKPRVSRQPGQVPGGHAYTRTNYHDAQGKVFLEHWLIHGAGHAWAGGSTGGSYADPKGPDAAGEMLRFFLEHALEQASAAAH
jgi:poly(hydroxyalkanoate) depolymerase family esterase